MKTILDRSIPFEPDDAFYNEISVSRLFEWYESIGFIYPAKKKLLEPHFDQITNNWNQLINSPDDLLWIMTNNPTNNNFASVSVIKQSNAGVMAQHLVSAGDPFASLKIMLGAQWRAEHCFDATTLNSSQNWFRPDNRYAFRVFASMIEKLGPQKASLLRFEYLHFPLDRINALPDTHFAIQEVTGIDKDFIAFVQTQYGQVFVEGEELHTEDIELKQLNESYKSRGLKYQRKTFKIIDEYTGKIVAAVIARRAPIGLNFSFLENRSYFIIDKTKTPDQLEPIVQTMLAAVKDFYQDFALQAIPITTDARTLPELQKQGAKYLRTYMQSIWMRTGFAQWFEHINSFLERIEQRRQRRTA